MKLTFTTSLLLLSAATASSTNGGGLRNRRLSLFGEESSKAASTQKKIGKAGKEKGEKKEAGAEGKAKNSSGKAKNSSGKGSKAEKTKAGNVIGGSKGAKSDFVKVESARPPSGITTGGDLYYGGEVITGTFELSAQVTGRRLQEIPSLNATDTLEEEDTIAMPAPEDRIDATSLEIVQVHLYQYMGRPNCDGDDPILSVDVTTTIDEDGTHQGSFSILTSKDMLKDWGLGYDLFVMDATGCKEILGPEAVTVTLSPEEQAAEDAAAEEKAKKAKTARGKAEKERSSTVKSYKKKKEKVDPSKITVVSKEALSTDDYLLTTDKEEYEEEEDIVVTYQVNAVPEAAATGRRLKQRKKKDKNKDKDNQPESEPIVITDEQIEEQPGAPVIDQPEPELQPTLLESEDEDEEGEQQPDLLPTDLAIEEETECDPTDITKYTLGVFMKMANPQGGRLRPLTEVPLCTSESCTADEVSSGSITIAAVDLDTDSNGKGFDIWVLDCTGDGIAGPTFFSIDV